MPSKYKVRSLFRGYGFDCFRAFIRRRALCRKDQHVRDQVPAVYSSRYILGCSFLLMGEPDAEGYFLEVSHHKHLKDTTAQQIRESLVDVSSDIVDMLKSVGSIRTGLPI